MCLSCGTTTNGQYLSFIRQDYLLDLWQAGKLGSEHHGNLNLYFSYSPGKVECSGLDLSQYISDYSDFPLVKE
jgi:hypothetical protein